MNDGNVQQAKREVSDALPGIFHHISSQLLQIFSTSAGEIWIPLTCVQCLQQTQMLLRTQTSASLVSLQPFFSFLPQSFNSPHVSVRET